MGSAHTRTAHPPDDDAWAKTKRYREQARDDVITALRNGNPAFLVFGVDTPVGLLLRRDASVDDGSVFWDIFPTDNYTALYDLENDLPYQSILEHAGYADPDCEAYYSYEYIAWYNTYLYNHFRENPTELEVYRTKDGPSLDLENNETEISQ